MEETVEKWFLDERGIEDSTLAAFGIHQEGDLVVFPYPDGEKCRRNPVTSEKRGFFFNGKMSLFESPTDPDYSPKQAFIVEGETDTLRLWQELESSSIKVYGLSGVEAWQPHYADEFRDYDKVFIILDNDEDYAVQTRVNNCWKNIRASLGAKCKRVYLPAGTKDICDFFKSYDLDAFREICIRKVAGAGRFKRLDLTQEPPPMKWLVEDLVCQGDVNLLIGAPGLGKSWLMMDLALGVIGGKSEWLGRPVKSNGPVLYIDEENPEDIIYHRFRKLGLKSSDAGKIHYLYRPGIWVNKEPDALLEEALNIEPSLIILDSLSRIHSEDENNANKMAELFRNGIQPLARETGAAVMVIHHTIKGDSENSFQRARGSGDLTAVVDAAFDVRGSESTGVFSISQYKSRRRMGGNIINLKLVDVGEKVVIETTGDLPF